jgi:hypothetical protein
VQIGHASVVRDCILLPGARVGAASRLTRTIVGRDCRIPDGTVLGNGVHAPYGTRSAGGVVVVTSEDFAEQAQPAGECVDPVQSWPSVAGLAQRDVQLAPLTRQVSRADSPLEGPFKLHAALRHLPERMPP